MAGAIVDSNDAFLTLLGFTRVNLNSVLRWTTITPPEYAAADHHALEAVAASGNCATNEKEFICYDGAPITAPRHLPFGVLRSVANDVWAAATAAT